MIRVLLADDNEVFLEGLRALAEREPRVTVVGTATNGADAVQLASVLDPDVALLDVLMPGMDGIEAAALIRAGSADVGIVLVSALDDSTTVAAALGAGANAFVTKHDAIDQLGEILVEAARARTSAKGLPPPAAPDADAPDALDADPPRP